MIRYIHIHAVRSNGVGLNVGELLLIPITATVRTDPQLQQQNKTTVRACPASTNHPSRPFARILYLAHVNISVFDDILDLLVASFQTEEWRRRRRLGPWRRLFPGS